MRGDRDKADILSEVRLPVISDPTLAPRQFGMDAYCRMMCQLYPVFPNRAALIARRRRADHGPVPVRFTLD